MSVERWAKNKARQTLRRAIGWPESQEVLDLFGLSYWYEGNLHHGRLAETPYRMPFTFVEAGVLGVNDFSIDADGSLRQKSPLPLERGRYVLDMAFAAQGTDNEMMCGIRQGGKDVFRYHAYSHLLAKDYRDWVLHLDKAGDIEIYFEFKNGSRDPTFAFENAHIKKVQEFDNVVSKPYF